MSPGPLESAQAGKISPLPLPPLEDSLAAFLQATRCLVSEEDQDDLQSQVDKALEAGSDVRRLDAALRRSWPSCDTCAEERAAAGGKEERLAAAEASSSDEFRHFADEAWLRAYSRSRAPLPVNSNPFFLMEEDASPLAQSQIGRAVSVVRSALAFHLAVQTGKLEPDHFRKTQLCMAQYSKMFSFCRVPRLGEDVPCRYESSRHVAVLANGHAFALPVVSECGTKVASAKALAAALTDIREEAKRLQPAMADGSAIGVLTSLDRDSWAAARSDLVDAGNLDALQSIESSILCICLDDSKHASMEDEAAGCLHGSSHIDEAAGVQRGSCINRWFDKSISVIVSATGSCGINFEHSLLDGHTVLRFVSDLVTDSLMSYARTINPSLPGVLPPLVDAIDDEDELDCTPVRIKWLTTAATRASVRAAESQLADQVCRVRLSALDFHEFGKSGIVRRKCSPDGFVQLALQLAHYSIYGKLVCTYETAMTKGFLHGRTEPIRAVRPSMLEFVRAFDELGAAAEGGDEGGRGSAAASSAHPPPSGAAARAEALRSALTDQVAATRRASSGMGGERHLFAISSLATSSGEEQPALFATRAWATLNESFLSTSNCGNPSLRLFGFGNVADYGFGVGYLIKNDGLVFCVSSQRRDSKRFTMALDRALKRMMDALA